VTIQWFHWETLGVVLAGLRAAYTEPSHARQETDTLMGAVRTPSKLTVHPWNTVAIQGRCHCNPEVHGVSDRGAGVQGSGALALAAQGSGASV